MTSNQNDCTKKKKKTKIGSFLSSEAAISQKRVGGKKLYILLWCRLDARAMHGVGMHFFFLNVGRGVRTYPQKILDKEKSVNFAQGARAIVFYFLLFSALFFADHRAKL